MVIFFPNFLTHVICRLKWFLIEFDNENSKSKPHGALIVSLHRLPYVTFSTAIQGRQSYHPHFIDEEAESQRSLRYLNKLLDKPLDMLEAESLTQLSLLPIWPLTNISQDTRCAVTTAFLWSLSSYAHWMSPLLQGEYWKNPMNTCLTKE